MKISYLFTARGNHFLEPVNAAIFSPSLPKVIEKSEALACSLFKAGYSSFALYGVSTEDLTLIKTFMVKQAAPEVVDTISKIF
jgi:hypothetical protein